MAILLSKCPGREMMLLAATAELLSRVISFVLQIIAGARSSLYRPRLAFEPQRIAFERQLRFCGDRKQGHNQQGTAKHGTEIEC